MSRASDELPDLDEFPLARAYGWVAARRSTGGILYLYPPVRMFNVRENICVMDLDSALSPSVRHEVDKVHRLNYNVEDRAKKRRGGREYSLPSPTDLKKMNTGRLMAVATRLKWNVERRGQDVRVIGRGQMSNIKFRKWLISEVRAARSREKISADA